MKKAFFIFLFAISMSLVTFSQPVRPSNLVAESDGECADLPYDDLTVYWSWSGNDQTTDYYEISYSSSHVIVYSHDGDNTDKSHWAYMSVSSGYDYGDLGIKVRACNGGGCSGWTYTTEYNRVYVAPGTPAAPSGSSTASTYEQKTYTTASGYDDYQWSVTGGGYSITDNGASADITFVTSGTFTIKVKRKTGCGWGDYSTGKSVSVN
jgi:hypothetical protein